MHKTGFYVVRIMEGRGFQREIAGGQHFRHSSTNELLHGGHVAQLALISRDSSQSKCVKYLQPGFK